MLFLVKHEKPDPNYSGNFEEEQLCFWFTFASHVILLIAQIFAFYRKIHSYSFLGEAILILAIFFFAIFPTIF